MTSLSKCVGGRLIWTDYDEETDTFTLLFDCPGSKLRAASVNVTALSENGMAVAKGILAEKLDKADNIMDLRYLVNLLDEETNEVDLAVAGPPKEATLPGVSCVSSVNPCQCGECEEEAEPCEPLTTTETHEQYTTCPNGCEEPAEVCPCKKGTEDGSESGICEKEAGGSPGEGTRSGEAS